MIIEVFKYVDRLMNMVRPRKLLYMAIGSLNYILKEKYYNIYINNY